MNFSVGLSKFVKLEETMVRYCSFMTIYPSLKEKLSHKPLSYEDRVLLNDSPRILKNQYLDALAAIPYCN